MPPQPQSLLASSRGKRLLAVLCAVAFLDFVDASITNIALPHIRAALGFSVQTLQWVPSAYLLTYGGLMLLGGRLADLFGRRRILLTGTALVATGSLTGGLAGSADLFVAARLTQGLGAALMLPAALSTLTTTFTGTDRARALGMWAAVGGLSSAVGVLLGGVLVEGPGWRWVMFVNPIACALLVPAILAVLPGDRPAATTARFDLAGSTLVTGGMLLLVFGLVQAPVHGWGAAATWLELSGAAALLAAFIAAERFVPDPILPLSTFRIRGLVAANLTGLIGFAGMLTMFFFLTLYMQTVLGYSPIAAGAAYLPLTFGVGISAGIGAKALTQVGSRPVICAGALIASAGLLLLAHVPVHGSYLPNILPGMMLFALGVGPVFVGVTTAANAGAPADRAGLVAAILNSAQQIGGALGLAIFSALATSQTDHLLATGHTARAAATAGFHRALLAGAVFTATAALVSLRTANTRADPIEAGHPAPSDDTSQHSVLVLGRSQRVLDDTTAALRELGYRADATNVFTDVVDRFDLKATDLVVFGGQVPPERKAELRAEIAAANPHVFFVEGLAGIPGLIVNQVRGAFAARTQEPAGTVAYLPDERSIRVTLPDQANVNVTAWWGTSFVPPDPKSDSLLLLSDRLASGDHTVPVPDLVPAKAAFATVQIDAGIYAFTIAT
jgi:EmrB/QacA subfamily drug resistance transporter